MTAVFVHIPKVGGVSIQAALDLQQYRYRSKLVKGARYDGLVTFGHCLPDRLIRDGYLDPADVFFFAFVLANKSMADSANLLAGSVEHYTFISSLSVYAQTRTPGIDESGAVGRLEDETAEEITGETYGPLKVLCELAVERAFPGRALQVRAGLIVGPFDPSDRFTYWPWRVSRGGSVLAPGRPATPVQFVDVRDLADWIIRMVEQRRAGVYNATGPEKPMTMGALLEACRAVSKGQTELVWVEEGFLLKAGVAPWSELPLWIPESDPDSAGFSAFDSSKAITAGLSFRSVAATVRDTLAWAATRPSDWQWRAGLDPDREAELLSRWQGRSDNMVE